MLSVVHLWAVSHSSGLRYVAQRALRGDTRGGRLLERCAVAVTVANARFEEQRHLADAGNVAKQDKMAGRRDEAS
ncbi:hypothetical protein NDU88_004370 [Pleurodeles waltl]|uniref:Uncharacterized protein n=1 Tax=Pleurodeles waltl TaxID=8319 RepID=A0AAV7T967_PLEWA|nr:hypothetical protein NDU88_004370 [Pleurodeles waltl]